jgi:hypothetical protein
MGTPNCGLITATSGSKGPADDAAARSQWRDSTADKVWGGLRTESWRAKAYLGSHRLVLPLSVVRKVAEQINEFM